MKGITDSVCEMCNRTILPRVGHAVVTAHGLVCADVTLDAEQKEERTKA